MSSARRTRRTRTRWTCDPTQGPKTRARPVCLCVHLCVREPPPPLASCRSCQRARAPAFSTCACMYHASGALLLPPRPRSPTHCVTTPRRCAALSHGTACYSARALRFSRLAANCERDRPAEPSHGAGSRTALPARRAAMGSPQRVLLACVAAWIAALWARGGEAAGSARLWPCACDGAGLRAPDTPGAARSTLSHFASAWELERLRALSKRGAGEEPGCVEPPCPRRWPRLLWRFAARTPPPPLAQDALGLPDPESGT